MNICCRLPDGSWSAPSGVSMSSFGVGQQIGGEVIDSIIVMNYRAAVKAFFDGGGQLQLGIGVSLAAGPFGRAADISASASNSSHIAATYSYCSSKGLYFGYSLEGSKISERVNTNQAYYGRPISAREILTGAVPPVEDAARLYEILNSLGAGPRPGLPFAPTKSKYASPETSSITSSLDNRMPYAPSTTSTSNIEGSNHAHQQPKASEEEYEDPPPPYQPSNTNTLPPHRIDSKTTYNEPSSSTTHTNPFYGNDLKESTSQPIHHNDMTVVVAKYDYHSDQSSDLSFQTGDHIIVTKRLDNRESWWEGEIGNKRGFFPANYTEDLD
ncbi:uncharacterized protein BX663DRAFT_505441 [Cokeromyces recurvatus]|uniref:uncharacterized protein n=1 Tax=Cokeromyces recurvatus TaxID=90255 RepID=UPI0022203D61|nr:uncharacterized protein BX663DRAFT_505441 [Cokeromyces recurvatus]KAI7903845.1 hypothetical protein BX663DRAFT_505441 [Cokeromyces recurvatus]